MTVRPEFGGNVFANERISRQSWCSPTRFVVTAQSANERRSRVTKAKSHTTNMTKKSENRRRKRDLRNQSSSSPAMKMTMMGTLLLSSSVTTVLAIDELIDGELGQHFRTSQLAAIIPYSLTSPFVSRMQLHFNLHFKLLFQHLL